MFIQRLKKESIAEYIDYHKNAWTDLLKALRDSGIKEEIIWLYKDLTLIYISAENFDESISEVTKMEVFKKWGEIMQNLFAEAPDYSKDVKIERLEKIFDLNEQLKSF